MVFYFKDGHAFSCSFLYKYEQDQGRDLLIIFFIFFFHLLYSLFSFIFISIYFCITIYLFIFTFFVFFSSSPHFLYMFLVFQMLNLFSFLFSRSGGWYSGWVGVGVKHLITRLSWQCYTASCKHYTDLTK